MLQGGPRDAAANFDTYSYYIVRFSLR